MRFLDKLLGRKQYTLQRLQLEPGDILVITCDGHITFETQTRIAQYFRSIDPDVKLMLLDGGLKLSAVLGRGGKIKATLEETIKTGQEKFK